VVTAVEHPAVLGAAKQLEREGFTTTIVPATADGVVDPAAVAAAVREDTVVVACMLAQNELGTILPVAEVARAARTRRAEVHVHCDAVQALGKVPVDVRALGCDSVAFSAHKLHGPKGVGALWLAKGARVLPLWSGGGQQHGLRSGTENVPGIVGLAEAARLAVARLADFAKLAELRQVFTDAALALGARENGARASRVPHIASLSFPRLRAEPLLHALEGLGVLVSAGAACAAKGGHGASHVLAAIGVPENAGTIRVSLSLDVTRAEVDTAARALAEAVESLA
jgi:cysteine desulfurase